jgi:CoA:oxalate CoA-transferase
MNERNGAHGPQANTPALAGLNVVEVGGGEAARYCGMLFADFGANVLRFPDLHAEWQPHGGLPVDYFGRMLDRGKYEIHERPDAERYAAALHGWLAGADVLIDGGAHGGLPAAGISYASLAESFPSLVIAALSLNGRDGPSAHQDGCELIAAARAADLQMTGAEERPPTRSASPKAEMYAGLLTFSAALAKLRLPASLRGGLVDISLSDALLSAMEGRVEHFFESGRVARRVGIKAVGYGVYQAVDGFVALSVAGTDANWRRFCKVANRPDLVEHPLLRDPLSRRHYPELVEGALEEWLKDKSRREVIEQLRSVGLLAAAVNTAAEVAADPQVEAMGLIAEGGDSERTWRCGGYPIELSATPAVRRGHLGPVPGGAWPERPVQAPATAAVEGQRHQPLSGLLVLEFGSGIAGPYGAMVLSDLGARVIKIEDPESADARFLNFCGSRRRNGKTETVLAGSYRERNKESLMLDLRVDGAREALDQIIGRADVVIANVAPGAMERFGLSEERLLAEHPGLVYASISCFGTRGPLSGLRGIDLLALAHSGFASLTGFPDDPPTRSGQSYSDYLAGLGLAAGIMVALYERDRSGRGQGVQTSLIGMAVTTLGGALEEYLETGKEMTRTGCLSYRFGGRCAVWEAGDGGHIAVDITAPAALAAFRALCRPMETGTSDPFEPEAEMAKFVSGQPAPEAAQRLQEAGVPAAVAGDLRLTASLSDFWTRGMFLHRAHPRYGTVVITGSPLRLGGLPLILRNLSPRPGENSEQILRELCGLDDRGIEQLRRSGALRESPLMRWEVRTKAAVG